MKWDFVSLRGGEGSTEMKEKRRGVGSLYVNWGVCSLVGGGAIQCPTPHGGPVWHFPRVPAGKPGGTQPEAGVRSGQFSLATQAWAGLPASKAAHLPGGASSPHRGGSRNARRRLGGVQEDGHPFVQLSGPDGAVAEDGGQGRFWSFQRTFLLMPLVAAVLGRRLHVFRGLSGCDARQLSL